MTQEVMSRLHESNVPSSVNQALDPNRKCDAKTAREVKHTEASHVVLIYTGVPCALIVMVV